MKAGDHWIECECPLFGADWDLFDGEIRGPDASIECLYCGNLHRIGDIGQFHVVVPGGIATLTEVGWRDLLVGHTPGTPITIDTR